MEKADYITSMRIKSVPMNCWEFNECKPEVCMECPAYPDHGRECWKVTGTKCAGGRYEKASFSEKIVHCRSKCGFYKKYLKDIFT